ncbi:unnamed protein product [Linum tenue]|uniref:Uncharacterized protein n=2 Tax=Linum tenue TaxID=586396 RepID=A0AAV0MRD1_9ROSI|nr:unnamed protein product [Linum tenue]
MPRGVCLQFREMHHYSSRIERSCRRIGNGLAAWS